MKSRIIGHLLAVAAGMQMVVVLALGAASDKAVLAIQDAISAGDLARADALLAPALAGRPNDAALLNLRGVVRAQRGEFAAARKDFSEAVKVDAALMPAWQNLARACQADADMDAASAACSQKAWQRVLNWRPNDAEALRGMAVGSERAGNYAASLQWLRKVQTDKEAATTDLMIRCLDLAGLKRLDEAQTAAALLAKQPDFGEGDLQAMDAAGAPVIVILGEALDAKGSLQAAGVRRLAFAYEQTNHLSEARKTLERVALAEPDNAQHLLELARVAEKQADHTGALGYLGHARELTPNDAQVHFLFAMVAAEMELPMEARRSLDRALALAPGNADYNYAMGSVILSTRDAASAAGYFEKYIAARPDDAKGHYALGVAEFTSGDYLKAKAQFHSVERAADVSGSAEFFLGRIARLEGDLQTAKKYLEKAMGLLPRFSETHTEMARVFMREDKLAEAGVELRKALELDSKSFQAHAQLVVLYKRLHDPRAEVEAETLKRLDEERTRRSELMLRGVEIRR